MGHWISFAITSLMMLVVGVYLYRPASSGHRSRLPRGKRWGPLATFCLAVPLIMADLCRHLAQDGGLWLECGHNPFYNRVNSTDPFPAQCAWSSSQYRCDVACCVPTFDAMPSGGVGWTSPQTYYFPAPNSTAPQFATLGANGTVVYAPTFNKSLLPYRVFAVPFVPSASGASAASPGGKSDDECVYGVNRETGYCYLVSPLAPPEVQRAQLPQKDGHGSCDCDECQPSENMANLSGVGILFTICFTYTGFILLSVAVLWNANIVSKMRRVRARWRELRGNRAIGA